MTGLLTITIFCLVIIGLGQLLAIFTEWQIRRQQTNPNKTLHESKIRYGGTKPIHSKSKRPPAPRGQGK